MECERCGAGPAGADLFGRCTLCGITLCDDCAATGCCGVTPAPEEDPGAPVASPSDDPGAPVARLGDKGPADEGPGNE